MTSRASLEGGEANVHTSFIAIKPDGVQVRLYSLNERQLLPRAELHFGLAKALRSEDSSGILSPDSRSAGIVLCSHSHTIRTDHVRRYKLAAIKLVTPSKEHLEKHYEDLSEKPFFKGLVTCMAFLLERLGI